MGRKAGKYALVQFCPVPERMEFLNIGVFLVVPDIGYFNVKIAKSNSRIERVFGKQSDQYVESVKQSFKFRLMSEFSRHFDDDYIESFSKKRANEIRISALQPIMVSEPDEALEGLFAELVGKEEYVPREPRIRKKLKEAFTKHRVVHFLDKPEEIELPEYGIKINAPFGYQNGCYNLVDGIRLGESVPDGLRELGKKALEGNLLWKHFEGQRSGCKRLIVVGDFSKQSNEFYHAAEDQLRDANMKLFRLDHLRPLLDDIESNAAAHSGNV